VWVVLGHLEYACRATSLIVEDDVYCSGSDLFSPTGTKYGPGYKHVGGVQDVRAPSSLCNKRLEAVSVLRNASSLLCPAGALAPPIRSPKCDLSRDHRSGLEAASEIRII